MAARKFTDRKLVIASHNKGKLVEIADLLAAFEVETLGADALGLPEPEETGSSFIANAELKALASARGMVESITALEDALRRAAPRGRAVAHFGVGNELLVCNLDDGARAEAPRA